MSFTGRGGIEQRPSHYVVMSVPGSPKREFTVLREDGEPFAPVSWVDLASDHSVALETGDEMSRSGRAKQHSIGKG